MVSIDFTDIKPQDAEVTFEKETSDGNKEFQTYRLRKITMDDEAWIRENFGKDSTLFTDRMSDEDLLRIAFHQLYSEDKEWFKKQTVTIMNDETGEKTQVQMGGWKLFRTQVRGMENKMQLFKAVLYIAGASRPMLDKMLSEEEKKLIGLTDEKDPKESDKDVKKKARTGRK